MDFLCSNCTQHKWKWENTGEWQKKFSTSLLSCTLIDVPLHQTVGFRLHGKIGRAVFCAVNGRNCVNFSVEQCLNFGWLTWVFWIVSDDLIFRIFIRFPGKIQRIIRENRISKIDQKEFSSKNPNIYFNDKNCSC